MREAHELNSQRSTLNSQLRQGSIPLVISQFTPIFHTLFMNRTPHVAVVGATGAVGVEMIKTLEKRKFPVGKLTLLASAR